MEGSAEDFAGTGAKVFSSVRAAGTPRGVEVKVGAGDGMEGWPVLFVVAARIAAWAMIVASGDPAEIEGSVAVVGAVGVGAMPAPCAVTVGFGAAGTEAGVGVDFGEPAKAEATMAAPVKSVLVHSGSAGGVDGVVALVDDQEVGAKNERGRAASATASLAELGDVEVLAGAADVERWPSHIAEA